MGYCVQFWLPYSQEVIVLKGVQKRFTKMLPETEDFNYGERRDWLGLFSLEQRKLRDELTKVCKIMRFGQGT